MQWEKAVAAHKSGEFRIDKRTCDFTRAIGAEVKEDHTVVRHDAGVRIMGADSGHDKFICDVFALRVDFLIGCADGCNRIFRLVALAVYHGGVGLFHTLPTIVAIHCVVTAHHGGDFTHTDFFELPFTLRNKIRAGGGGHVAAVEQAVDINFFQPHALCKLHERPKVRVMAVYAAI